MDRPFTSLAGDSPLASAGAILSAKALSETGIKAAEAATRAAAATPGLPAAKMAQETTKATAEAMSSTIVSRAGGADIHNCATPLPLPPDGRLVVIGGSLTIILIKRLAASRLGHTIVEALGLPNKILAGCATVLICG